MARDQITFLKKDENFKVNNGNSGAPRARFAHAWT